MTKLEATAQKKPTNRWLDVQIVIATMGMAFSLFLWNLFASGTREVQLVTTSSVQEPSQATSVSNLPTPQPLTRILLGGAAPQAPSIPAPVTNTGSSKP